MHSKPAPPLRLFKMAYTEPRAVTPLDVRERGSSRRRMVLSQIFLIKIGALLIFFNGVIDGAGQNTRTLQITRFRTAT